ncbi:nuclear transport factor 2 family protein [Flavobacterium sp. J27]|uniref:nuclear transport factor 2 family protein n=1 Tax=Flavobacterium sp. J27 TaxID=2060419 RepID=UPI001031DCE9|nr:nuclear transport factor 2 family protein [Flavobacterium sp. J27]
MKKIKNKVFILTDVSKEMKVSTSKNLMKKFLITLAITIVSIVNVEAQKSNVDTNSNKTVMRNFYQRYIEAANNRDFETIASMVSEDVLINGKKTKKEESIAGFKQVFDMIPNHKWHIEDLYIDGERLAVRLRNTGTPKENSVLGINPDGKSVEFTEFASYRIHNGKFVEMWYLVDVEKISEQLNNNSNPTALEVVNRFFDRFKNGATPEELANFFDEKAEHYIPGDTVHVPWIGKRTGRKEIAEHFRLLKLHIQPQKLSFTDIVAQGNRVVVLGYLESLMKNNGNVMKSQFTIDIVVENGLITHYYLLEDSFEIARAVNAKKNKK